MSRALRSMLTPWRIIGLICVAGGLYATFLRFTKGLGASSNMSDTFPWGIWIGFDMLCGVGLAAGGFTISAAVYVFKLERFRPIVRPAILTAFIGYVLAIGGLMYDLGHPWRIWHATIMWNHHSVMFEVAWCVMLYTTVLAAEVSAMVFEKLQWNRAAHVAHVLTFPLTIAAVCLSMLHQSSLGSMFLIVPGRLHALWYTPIIPFLFFISAMGAGLVMTIIESTLSARAFGRGIEADILQSLARGASILMGLYLMLRIGDMIRSGAILELWPLDRAALFFLVEISLGFLIPMILFSQSWLRKNTRWTYHAAQLAVLGFIINRLNVSVTGFEVINGKTYVPAWTEVAVTLMLVTIGVTFFYLAARHLPVFEQEVSLEERDRQWQAEEERRSSYGLPAATVRHRA